MEYRKLGDTIVLCLVRGEDVLASIRAVCNAERVRLAAACGTASVMLDGTAVADKAEAMAVMENVRVEEMDG